MPELPEVEVVRRGLASWVSGRTISAVEVLNQRAIRAHIGGERDFISVLRGRSIVSVSRRGKYMWFVLDNDLAIVTHLGMSGQVLIQPIDAPREKHLRIRFTFKGGDRALHFVDQRTFGGMAIHELIQIGNGQRLPEPVLHIFRDPLDPDFDISQCIAGLRKKNTQIKRALLDQTVVSGIGNIYADEALWRSQLQWAYPTNRLSVAKAQLLIQNATAVMSEALAQGGTSFDALYVNVNGESGYFSRDLNAYGREGQPCDRCGSLMVRDHFMNRSSFRCPRCQPKPRGIEIPEK